MKSRIYWSWEMGKKVAGTAVVADVWGATTNLAIFLKRGVKRLFLVNREQAVGIKKKKGAVLVGEDLTLAKNFFAVGNHPADVVKARLGKEVYYMSVNGTRVIGESLDKGARQVLGLSFVNMEVMRQWLEKREAVDLVAAGERMYEDAKCPEDWYCIKMLAGKANKLEEIEKEFFKYYQDKPEDQVKLRKDATIVFKLNSYPVVPVCRKDGIGLIRVTME